MPTALGAPPARLKLLVDKDEAIRILRTHIEVGSAIKKQRLRSALALEAAREQKLKWTQQTNAVLGQLFSSEEVTEEFNDWVGKILPEYADLAQFIERFYDEMDHRVGRLNEIIKRIESEPDIVPRRVPPQPAMAKPPTPMMQQPQSSSSDSPPAPAHPSPAPPAPSHHHRVGALIVRTHDESAEQSVREFVTKLGPELIVVSNTTDRQSGLIETLSHHKEIRFILLLAPENAPAEDEAAAGSFRRSVFELGYCCGRLGLERICILHTAGRGLVRDEHGILHIPLYECEGWQLHLAKHLKRS